MWNLHGAWSLTLESPEVSHNFAEFSVVQACFPVIFKGRSLAYPLNPVWIFSGIALCG